MSIKKQDLKKLENSKYAQFALPIAILSVSTAAIFIRFAQNSIPSITIAAYRLIFASIFLFPFTIKKTIREFREINQKYFLLVISSGVFLALHFASWIMSLESTNVISSVVLVTTTPLWVTAFSPLVLHEKVPRRFLFGLCIAFLGVLMISFVGVGEISGWGINIFYQKNTPSIVGNILALFGAICAACYVVIGRILRRHISNSSYILSVYSTSAFTLTLFILLNHQYSLSINYSDIKWLVLLALIPQVIGHSLINWSLGILPAFFVAISLLGEPIGSTIMAIIFLKEIPSVNEVVSAVIILAGIFIAISNPKRGEC